MKAHTAGVLALGAALMLSACDQKSGQQQAAPPPAQVGVVTLKAQSVTLQTELPGRVNAYQTADIRPQVSGVILRRLFVEGGMVKAGDALYEIDPAPYEASLASAKATLLKAQAEARSALLTVNRYKQLTQSHAVSPQDYDNALATYQQAQADVASGQAGVQTAQINLNYTKMYAPITGRIGRSTVTPGALVTANQTTALATITQLDPIYVDVTQPSTTMLRLRRELASGQLKSAGPNQAEARVVMEDNTPYGPTGKLQFSEVTVDQTTGSVLMRSLFPNPNGDLLPGMFVRERLDEGESPNALLVPQQGVTRNQQGNPTALVVQADNTVALRTIQTDRTVGTDWLVTGGLKAGDKVIVEGVQRAAPGAKVNPVEIAPDKIGEQVVASPPGNGQH